jgi:hypothetical protein
MGHTMGKNKKSKKKETSFSKVQSSNVIDFNSVRVQGLHQTDPMGASWRAYPRSELRLELINRLKLKPEDSRTGDDW